MMKMTNAIAAGAMSVVLCSCSVLQGDKTIVASVYPLAFAAERLAPEGWKVIDLTPPGTEAHDLELSLEDRAAIEDADLVLYLGDIGFQPQVEAAVGESEERVVDVSGGVELGGSGSVDPHVWLAPSSFVTTTSLIVGELCSSEDPCSAEGHDDREAFSQEVMDLGNDYFLGLQDCRFETIIASHEAFGHLAQFHGLRQFGLTGTTPEVEPSAARLSEARRLVEAGEAGAIFYEDHDNARRIAESFANDADVPALPLSTLESRPAEGDYFTVMQDNLESLREGLQCR